MISRRSDRYRWIPVSLAAVAVLLAGACKAGPSTALPAVVPSSTPAASPSAAPPSTPPTVVPATTPASTTPAPVVTTHRPTPAVTHSKPASSAAMSCPAYLAAIKNTFTAEGVVSTSHGSPTVFTLNPKILAACPAIRVKVATAIYAAPGADPPTLTLFSQSTATLSAAHPHATLSTIKAPDPGCTKTVWLFMMLPGEKSMPHQVPRSPDHLLEPFSAIDARLITAPNWGTPDCPVP